jgi:hypothetical protein
LLLFRLCGLLLFRLAERVFDALLFQLPPRLTRFVPEEGPVVYSITETPRPGKQGHRRQ